MTVEELIKELEKAPKHYELFHFVADEIGEPFEKTIGSVNIHYHRGQIELY